MNLESVLGESLQNCGIKHNVPFTNRTGRRAIVHEGRGNGSMIVFTSDCGAHQHPTLFMTEEPACWT